MISINTDDRSSESIIISADEEKKEYEIKNIILASKSKGRAKILLDMGIAAKTYPTEVIEEFEVNLAPGEIVMQLSERKAKKAAEEIGKPTTLIIAADTIVYYDGLVLGKPSGREDAFNTLAMLSGGYHEVYTGLTLILGETCATDYVTTRVKFRSLTTYEIEEYVKQGDCLSRAGSYGAQGIGASFIEHIEGDYLNIIGLPVCKMSQMIAEYFSKNIFDLL